MTSRTQLTAVETSYVATCDMVRHLMSVLETCPTTDPRVLQSVQKLTASMLHLQVKFLSPGEPGLSSPQESCCSSPEESEPELVPEPEPAPVVKPQKKKKQKKTPGPQATKVNNLTQVYSYLEEYLYSINKVFCSRISALLLCYTFKLDEFPTAFEPVYQACLPSKDDLQIQCIGCPKWFSKEELFGHIASSAPCSQQYRESGSCSEPLATLLYCKFCHDLLLINAAKFSRHMEDHFNCDYHVQRYRKSKMGSSNSLSSQRSRKP